MEQTADTFSAQTSATRPSFRAYPGMVKDAAVAWSGDNVSRLSAALAYYAVFSLAPLLVIVIAITGLIFGEEAARNQISGGISGWVGPQAAQTIESAVAATAKAKSAGIWTLVLGLATLLFGASTFFGELKNALNTIWGVAVKPGQPIMTLIRDRLLSFSMVLCIGFLLIVSLLISAVVSGVSHWLAASLPLPPIVWQSVDFIVSIGVISSLFAMIFKFLPNVRLRWKDVIPGAVVTALLFTVGKSLIAWYLGTASIGSAFGAAGSLIVILLWVYYATCILLFGAEITKVTTQRYGHPIVPDAHGILAKNP